MQIPQILARINQQLDPSSSEEFLQNASAVQLFDLGEVARFFRDCHATPPSPASSTSSDR
jgi:hypothetical protein